ncbi:hypothetical protein MTO98_15805 [Mucilaginibacter sp. SMC90]|nr:hypothetical protein [Mucilaginibacter sp. SMC90]UOE52541.1 hypothetical protein MTO98_15805 [Mucilaginibacter sp. SMC90]
MIQQISNEIDELNIKVIACGNVGTFELLYCVYKTVRFNIRTRSSQYLR